MLFITIAAILILSYSLFLLGYIIWLYWSTEKTIKNCSSFQKNDGNNKKALFIGDSLVYGTGASSIEKSIAGLFSSRFQDYDLCNLSENRITTKELSGKIENILRDLKNFDKTILSIGGNDVVRLKSMNGINEKLNFIFEVLTNKSKMVYVFLPTKPGKSPWPLKQMTHRRISILRRNIIQIAEQKNNVVIIDMWQSGDRMLKESEKYFVGDTVHMSDAGQKFWFDELMKQIEKEPFDSVNS